MDPESLLKERRPADALAALQDRVRRDPANAKERVFLFQLLTVLGQWDRALTQLNVAADLDAGNLMMAQAYREALRCEVLRQDVFAGKRTPVVFGQPAEWVALMIEAARLDAEGQHGQAGPLRARALAAAPATSGSLVASDPESDPIAFEWIADADSRLGPILEIVVNGRYLWAPFENIAAIHLEPPADLRDLVWMPVNVQWSNGGEAVGLVPTRYPGSESSPDGELQLAHRTEWQEIGPDQFTGLGQRLLATDVADYPLMDLRRVRLETGDANAADG